MENNKKYFLKVKTPDVSEKIQGQNSQVILITFF
jgi:hypothetical protein